MRPVGWKMSNRLSWKRNVFAINIAILFSINRKIIIEFTGQMDEIIQIKSTQKNKECWVLWTNCTMKYGYSPFGHIFYQTIYRIFIEQWIRSFPFWQLNWLHAKFPNSKCIRYAERCTLCTKTNNKIIFSQIINICTA